MPQMAPMSWTTLFIFFLTVMMAITMMNYYNLTPKSKEMGEKLYYTKSMNWLW